MKTSVLMAAAWMIAVGAFAQGQFGGQFLFTNRDAAAGVDARFYNLGDPIGVSSSVGAGYQITLFGGSPGGALTEVATDTFRTNPHAAIGYVVPLTVTVPTVQDGQAAVVRVDIADPAGQAVFSQDYGPFVLDRETVPTLPMGNAPMVLGIPEPTTLRLAALGLGTLLLIRRRQ